MEKEIVEENIEIVMFFKNVTEYNTIQLANIIYEKLPELGQPNVFNIPNDVPNEIRMQAPRIIFNNTKYLNVTITNSKVNIILFNENNIKHYIEAIYNSLNEFNINIVSIGIIKNCISYGINIQKLKEYFKEDEIINCDLLNFSWYKKIDEKNIWKQIETQVEDESINLKYTIDVNNLGNSTSMNMKGILKVLEDATKIANDAINKISKKLGD